MSQWLSGDVSVNGVKLHYTRTGGNKSPVVTAHGITDNGLCWTSVAQGLEAEYDVLMYDARGHGLSEAPDTGYTYDILAADLAGLCQALDIHKPALIGHSMGAETVAVAAASYPELARGVVLCDPPWRDAAPAADPVAAQSAVAEQFRNQVLNYQAMTREQLIAFRRAQNKRRGSVAWSETDLECFAQAQLQVNLKAIQVTGSPRRPWRELVGAITCPILLITADPEKGSIVSPQIAREAEGLWRAGKVVRIRGAGHSIRREGFAEYMEAVRAFLREVA